MVEHYLDGYLSATGNEEQLDYRIQVYLALKAEESPNFKVEWNMNFMY